MVLGKRYISVFMKKKVVVVKSNVYRFNPVGDREGRPSKYHHLYVDAHDFQVNPKLIQQINFAACPEQTPEGRALWLYTRLCQILKYDENYFFNNTQCNPNYDLQESFKIVEKVTAETPVSCYNFVRIAVKLLNQIQGVHAVMIAVGKIGGHLRFGFYTDKITVDAEATTPLEHFSDMARVKLGVMPCGLKFLHGKNLEEGLRRDVIAPMLAKQQAVQSYLKQLQTVPAEQQFAQVMPLVETLRQYRVDGNTVVQTLVNWKHRFTQPIYRLLRMGMINGAGQVEPQLLARQKQQLVRIDLNQMQAFALSATELGRALASGQLVDIDEQASAPVEERAKKCTLRENFWRGLKIKTHGMIDKGLTL